MGRHVLALIVVLSALSVGSLSCEKRFPPEGQHPAHFDAIGPRLVSNQAQFPVTLYGEGLTAGCVLKLRGPVNRSLPTTWIDQNHLAAVIPSSLTSAEGPSEVTLDITLASATGVILQGSDSLTVINDLGFPSPRAMVTTSSGEKAFVAVLTTNQVWVYSRKGEPVQKISVAEGPRDLVLIPADASANVGEKVAVIHEFSGEVRVLDAAQPEAAQEKFSVGANAQSAVFDPVGRQLLITNHQTDHLDVVDWKSKTLAFSIPLGVNPNSLAFDARALSVAVGNVGSGDVSLVNLKNRTEQRTTSTFETTILGGHTETFQKYVMGGKAPRALAAFPLKETFFVASVGPNIGPNPQRMEVSMNGGISVVDAKTAKILRHVSLGGGIPQSMVLDARRNTLFVADISLGRVVSFDALRLAGTDSSARTAMLGSVKMPVPSTTDWFRPSSDFGVKGRSGLEIHSGPQALALLDQGRSLLVLSRFNGTLTEMDVTDPRNMRVRKVWPGPSMGSQALRRRGEIIYFSDLGNSSMSCDGCHLEGHNDGVLFEKSHPLHIYRVSSLRGARLTPPYFFPGPLPSLEVTAERVLARNRFQNPIPTPGEIEALTEYQKMFGWLPNPHRTLEGGLPPSLQLPDGEIGRPAQGMKLFEGKGGCATSACHPAPLFTPDQSPPFRGRSHRVGTPIALPLHAELQFMPPTGLPVPSLIGVWDVFPLLESGEGGLDVVNNQALEPRFPFALRRVLEHPLRQMHGNMAALSDSERNDVLAYLLTL